MKNLILPALIVLGILGGLIFWGAKSSPSTPSTQAIYFDDKAKVMYFYSDLCSWCQKQKIVLEDLAKEGFKVKPMDVKAKPELWTQYNIKGTPTFIASDGQRLVGYTKKEKLKEFLEKYK